jgi:NAD+ kinase
MRIAFFGLQFYEKYLSTYQLMIDKLEKVKCQLLFNESFYKMASSKVKFKSDVKVYSSPNDIIEQPDAYISVGGDGTFLDAITFVGDSGTPILGINMGRLGFLSSVSHIDAEKAIDALINNNYISEKRAMLTLHTDNNLFGKFNYALNEITIQKKDHLSMIVIHVYINDLFLNSYWSDGLLISTPTGSTAYALSVGGPIVVPGSENFIISPIAPHNLTVRPIVIPNSSTIKLKVQGRSSSFLVGLDSRFETIDSSIELVVKPSDFSINLIQIGGRSFFDTIRDKLNWGLDIRN